MICWKSKKQHIASRSSSEAKFRALFNATCDAQWLLYLLHDLMIQQNQPINIFFDNLSSIHIANNQFFHVHTKHIEMDFHIVRDKLQQKIIHLHQTASHWSFSLSNCLVVFLYLGSVFLALNIASLLQFFY